MKDNRIEIPITISTEYQYTTGNANDFAREQIEHAQLYLQSVFNFIRHAATNLESDFAHDENQKVSAFCYDLMNFADIGNALAMSIWKAVSGMEFKASGSETIAAQLASLINNENVPVEISEAIQDAINEMMNASKQTEVLEYEKSPEYIAKVLRDYKSE